MGPYTNRSPFLNKKPFSKLAKRVKLTWCEYAVL